MHSATRGTHFIEFLHAEVSVNPSLNHLVFTTSRVNPRWHKNFCFLHWILHWISNCWSFHGPKASNNPTLNHWSYMKLHLNNIAIFLDVPVSGGVEHRLGSVFGWIKDCDMFFWCSYMSYTWAIHFLGCSLCSLFLVTRYILNFFAAFLLPHRILHFLY